MHHTIHAETPMAKRVEPPPVLPSKSSADRSRERIADLRRERLVAAWLRSLSPRSAR